MFSVVIPAYNAQNFIANSIGSVLAQSVKDFELIVVDDGSTDATRAQIENFSDKRIHYIYQENQGVSAARNKGIEESRGEYICFLDADDEWKPEHLLVMKGLIERYNMCGFYVSGYDIRLSNGTLINKSEQILEKIDNNEFKSDDGYEILNTYGYFLNTNTVCCRREVFDKVGLFRVGVKNGEDDDMWYRIFAYYSVAVSKRSTTVYDRANCGATGQRGAVSEPPFLQRVPGILESAEVPQHRKESLLCWMERNKLSRARKHILAGNKSEAYNLLKKLDVKKVNKKKYFETLLCLVIPTRFVQKHIYNRDKGYYQE